MLNNLNSITDAYKPAVWLVEWAAPLIRNSSVGEWIIHHSIKLPLSITSKFSHFWRKNRILHELFIPGEVWLKRAFFEFLLPLFQLWVKLCSFSLLKGLLRPFKIVWQRVKIDGTTFLKPRVSFTFCFKVILFLEMSAFSILTFYSNDADFWLFLRSTGSEINKTLSKQSR